MTGSITDTYVAAIQHGLVEFDDATELVGVVRRPTRWFNPQVDENLQALGPPTELFEDFQDRRDALVDDGLDEATAHNTAWDDVDYDDRYLDHLTTAPEAQAAVTDLLDRLADGRDVALVCYENTEDKRCHRTVLRRYLNERADQDAGAATDITDRGGP